jgi:hypothetical protein
MRTIFLEMCLFNDATLEQASIFYTENGQVNINAGHEQIREREKG